MSDRMDGYNDGDIYHVKSCDMVMMFWRYPDGYECWVSFGRKAMYPVDSVDLTDAVLIATVRSQVAYP